MILHREIVEIVHTPCCSHGRRCDLGCLYRFVKPEASQITEKRFKLYPLRVCGPPTWPLWAPLCYLLGCTVTNNCKFEIFVFPLLIQNIFIWLKLLVTVSGHMSLNWTGEKKSTYNESSIMQFSLDVLHSVYSNVCFTQSIKNIRSGLTN